jgi:hypothetical protein
MPGMLIFAFFATLVILRAARTPGGGRTSGIMLMGFGILLLWAGAVRHHDEFYPLDDMPRIASLLLGAWLVVKGALRASAY